MKPNDINESYSHYSGLTSACSTTRRVGAILAACGILGVVPVY